MTYLEVKNWDQFQHYRDRTPVWVKLYLTLLDDYDFAQLSDAERGQLVMIWLLAARNNGRIPNDPKWVTGRITCSGPLRLSKLVRDGWLVPVSPEQSASTPLAGSEQSACLDKEERRGEERREDAAASASAPRGWSGFWDAVPEPYRDAVRAALRASGSSNALRQTLVAMTEAMGQPGDQVFAPDVVAQAVHEIAVTGDHLTPLRLRTFAGRIARDRKAAQSDPEGDLYAA